MWGVKVEKITLSGNPTSSLTPNILFNAFFSVHPLPLQTSKVLQFRVLVLNFEFRPPPPLNSG